MLLNKDKVYLLLAEKQYTITAFCKETGLDHKTLKSAISKGARTDTVGRIAAALGVPVAELLEKEKDTSTDQSKVS